MMKWIAEIVKNCKENPDYFRLNIDRSKAETHPKGEKEFFKELIYELHSDIEKTMIGGYWLNKGRINPFQKDRENKVYWIDSTVQSSAKFIDPDKLKNDVKEFFEVFFYIQLIQSELKGGLTKYENLYKTPEDCQRITKIMDEHCSAGIFQGFEGIEISAERQLSLIFELLHKTHIFKHNLIGSAKNVFLCLFYERFGYKGYRDGKKTDYSISLRNKRTPRTGKEKEALTDIKLILEI